MDSDKDTATSDIVLAATLKVLGFKLSNIQKNGNKGIFFFESVPDDIVNKYDIGGLSVEPIAFNAAIKALTTATRRSI